MSPPSSVPSKRSNPESFSDSGPSRRPSAGPRHADTTRGPIHPPTLPSSSRAETSITPTSHTPERSRHSPEIVPYRLQPTTRAVVPIPTRFGSIPPHFQLHPRVPPNNPRGGVVEQDQPLPSNVTPVAKPQTHPTDGHLTGQPVSTMGDHYGVEIVDRQVGSGALATENSLVTFQFAVRNPRTKQTTQTGTVCSPRSPIFIARSLHLVVLCNTDIGHPRHGSW